MSLRSILYNHYISTLENDGTFETGEAIATGLDIRTKNSYYEPNDIMYLKGADFEAKCKELSGPVKTYKISEIEGVK